MVVFVYVIRILQNMKLTAFEKKSQENLTNEEKNVLKKLVKSLKEETAKNRR